MQRNFTVPTVLSVLFFLFCNLEWGIVRSVPVEQSGDTSSFDKYAGPVMVPVSSTVIPLLHLFGKPKPLQSTNHQHSSKRTALYLSPERRARLFSESAARPDAPVRLITKNSKGKDINNETH